jgi:hypothetical protein
LPIPELVVPNADLNLLFLSGNGVDFFEKTDDPWYRATVPDDLFSFPGYPLHQLYRPEEAASPLGCTEQMQFCNATWGCGPLAGALDALEGALSSFNTTVPCFGDREPGCPPSNLSSRLNWFSNILYIAQTTAYNLFLNGPQALASEASLFQGTMGPLPDNQWQIDVQHWFATFLAALQTGVVLAATGSSNSILQNISWTPADPYQKDMCNNQVRSHLTLQFWNHDC